MGTPLDIAFDKLIIPQGVFFLTAYISLLFLKLCTLLALKLYL